MHKLCQDLVDSTFKYLRYQKEGTPFQKTTSKKGLIRAIENAHEFLEGSGKILKIKPPPKIVTYRTPNKYVTMVSKD